uniref:Uncharacterized protein n=1 Tax=Megaselia scalaris TaxID=36166 RepID=T1GJF1_MEGSC
MQVNEEKTKYLLSTLEKKQVKSHSMTEQCGHTITIRGSCHNTTSYAFESAGYQQIVAKVLGCEQDSLSFDNSGDDPLQYLEELETIIYNLRNSKMV